MLIFNPNITNYRLHVHVELQYDEKKKKFEAESPFVKRLWNTD